MNHNATPAILATVSPERQSALNLYSAVRRYLRAQKAVAEAPTSEVAEEELCRATEILGGAQLVFALHWGVGAERGER